MADHQMSAPIQPVRAKNERIYTCGADLKIQASLQPELHAALVDIERAAKMLSQDARSGDMPAMLLRLTQDMLPAIVAFHERVIAKVGGLQHWCGKLDEDLDKLDEDLDAVAEGGLGVEEADGKQINETLDALFHALEAAVAGHVPDAVALEALRQKTEAAKVLVLEYVGEEEGEEGEAEEGEAQ